MGLRDINMTNWLVSDNYQNNLLLIASMIPLQPTPVRWKIYIPLLDEVDDGEIFSTCIFIHFQFRTTFHIGHQYF